MATAEITQVPEYKDFACHSTHRVQFYKEDEFLARTVAEHLAPALVSGGSGIVLATPEHNPHIIEQLRILEVPEVSSSQLLMLDASQTLSKFMRAGVPDGALFRSTLEQAVQQLAACPTQVPIAAFGEMVALLWQEGKREAAVRLEQLWNDFLAEHRMSLLCAYPLAYFSRADDRALFMEVCATHSSVLPAESFVSSIVAEQQAREIAELQQRAEALAREVAARKSAEDHLRAVQADLEFLVEQRTRALRQLSLNVLKLQDVERRRVARELHDSVGQDFAGLKMNLDLAKKSPGDAELWNKCDRLLEHCIHQVRTLSNLLHPPLIEDAGVATAAEWYVQDFSRRTKIRVSAEGLGNLSALAEHAKLVLFRVLQECLINIYRHARATRASVSATADSDSIHLVISDDGIGITAAKVNAFNKTGTGMGVGLTSIRERVHDLGGRCKIKSGKSGTAIHMSVPRS